MKGLYNNFADFPAVRICGPARCAVVEPPPEAEVRVEVAPSHEMQAMSNFRNTMCTVPQQKVLFVLDLLCAQRRPQDIQACLECFAQQHCLSVVFLGLDGVQNPKSNLCDEGVVAFWVEKMEDGLWERWLADPRAKIEVPHATSFSLISVKPQCP